MDVLGTTFDVSVLPVRSFLRGGKAKTEIVIKNEFINYREVGRSFHYDDLENWITSMFRLLAGAYGKPYSLSFEGAGFAVELIPHTENGAEVSRQKRRQNDCMMSVSLLMRTRNRKKLLGGVYTVVLHRKEIETLASKLKAEYETAYARFRRKRGKYLFAGVSPLGYVGCEYFYLDPSKSVSAGDYVWACMGRHNVEQILYVDSVRWHSDKTAPFPPDRVKCVLRKATEEEVQTALKDKT